MDMIEKYQDQLFSLTEHFDSSFYFYDLDGMGQHFKNIQGAIEEHSFEGFKLWYATKANPISAILRTVKEHNFGIDVASQGELNQALFSGFSGENILSTGPSKSKKYLNSLVKHQINTVVCESLNQVYWLNAAAERLEKKPNVLLRVQLDWEDGTSVLGGNAITPFGIDPSMWHDLVLKQTKHLNIQGFHVFQWGNILDIDRLEQIWHKISLEIKELALKLKLPFKVLDLGGGLGINYSQNSNSPNLKIEFSKIVKILKDIKEKYHFEEIWMELGRYLVGEYGLYLTQIIDVKNVRGKKILVTDGGINHMARPALTNEAFPCSTLHQSSSAHTDYQIHGPLCTALDCLGSFSLPDDLAPGHWLVFSQTGAYGMTESMPYFLCHNLPAEVIVKNGQTQILRAVETSAKWLV